MDFMLLIICLISVETPNCECPDNSSCYCQGDGGRSWGQLQISNGVIIDVNRKYGTNYSHNDAYNRRDAVMICWLYLGMYGARSYEDAARMWCAGPDGTDQACSLPYWGKVKAALDSRL